MICSADKQVGTLVLLITSIKQSVQQKLLFLKAENISRSATITEAETLVVLQPLQQYHPCYEPRIDIETRSSTVTTQNGLLQTALHSYLGSIIQDCLP
jgi:hypothetical protein